MFNQKIKFNKQIVECVGLWLAEGDNKCNNEITFTNNEPSLIKFFNKNIRKLFALHKFNIRLYVYSPNNRDVNIPIKTDKINFYKDKRANKPYFIWRLASVDLHREWKKIVEECKKDSKYWTDILRGFFAGEGNIKSTSHNCRTIRIAQKRSIFLEKLLKYIDVEFKYRKENRSYTITHKFNWDKLANIHIADLHPIKKEKFWKIYGEFKEEHYKHNYLKDFIFRLLSQHYLPSELAASFDRSKARIQEILVDLKKEGKISDFRVGSINYWIRNDQNVIIVSKLKKKYIDLLTKSYKTTKEIANYFKVNDKSSYRRLKELEKLGLVKKKEDKRWQRVNSGKEVVII